MESSSPTPGWAAHLPAGVTREKLDLLADRTLPGRWARRWGERLRSPQLQDVDGAWINSDELEERTRLAAQALLASGLAQGDRLLISAATSAAFVIAYVAALRAGLVVVPVNTAYTSAELMRIVVGARPAGAVLDSSERAAWIHAASRGSTAVFDLDLGGLTAPDRAAKIDRVDSADPALLLYTSGTTGEPKGALLTHGNLLAGATAVNLAWRWREDDVLLLALPLFHLHGLGVGINGSLCAGSSIVLRPGFEADDVARRCTAGISMFFGVPTMYQRLASSGGAAALAPLRLLVCGSAPLPAALANEIAVTCGQIPLERYGMTETVMLTSNPYDGPRKPGTVGFALPGVELRLARPAPGSGSHPGAGSDSGSGSGSAHGEVQVRGPSVIGGYYERPDATAEAFTADGWFRTGDLGQFDEGGYLRLVGRSKELIITGGYNVHPREVEEALATHADVREVAVVGRPSEAWGEEVTAVVVAERPVSAEQLRAHAGRVLAPYKVPKRIEFTAQLPRNAMGKVIRTEL